MADDLSSLSVYLNGSTPTSGATSSYVRGVGTASGFQYAYVGGALGSKSSRRYAYLAGLLRSHLGCYLGGVIVAVPYVWLKTSDNGVTRSKKFRVLAQDYDDGTKERAESIERTIGGGIDHSVGAVYTSWAPIIRVRASESETDYGDKDDLEYFYELGNPNGTPSNNITFIDNHQVSYVVHFVGRMTKNLLGCQVEGAEAWYLYRLQMIKVR